MNEGRAQVEAMVAEALAQGEGVKVDTPGRDLYLDLAETVVRQASAWQFDDGTIGDPHNAPGVESVTATARYCAAIGHLVAAGRCGDLLESGARAMDRCCARLVAHLEAGESWPCANFELKDMMVLFAAARGRVSPERWERWRQALGGWEPEQVYCGHHNWWFYGTAAEAQRIEHGLSARVDWIDAILDEQMGHWSAHGMYRDPNDPVTYDLTVRQSLAMMLAHGYQGRYERWARETLRTGALTTLLMVSPTGVVPAGGRSAQYQMQEAMLAWLAEWQARQEAAAGDLALAGALRRMALAGAEATARWLLREPYAVMKHPMVGEHPFYGQDGFAAEHNAHSGYGLLAANLFAGAWHQADERIAPRAAPADVGGYVLHLADAFYRVFATAGGWHVEVDTRGQAGYDATGLVRVHRRGAPVELALSMGIAAAPRYAMPLRPAARSVAFGPGWQSASGPGAGWRWLSELTREDEHEVRVEVVRMGERVEFEVAYLSVPGAPRGDVRERYALSAEGLRYEARVPGAERVRLQVPALVTDGEARSRIEMGESGLRVSYRGHGYAVRLTVAAERAFIEDWDAPNRNGVYRVVVFEAMGERVGCEVGMR